MGQIRVLTTKYFELSISFTIVFLSGLLEYWVIDSGFPYGLSLVMIFVCCLIKTSVILYRSFKRIVGISHEDVPYHRFLLFVAANIILVVFSFSIDYFCVFELDNGTFSGLENTSNDLERFFKLFYLSLLLFTNMGVANVVPLTIPAETLVMFEAIVSFITLIFILSDYVTLRDSLSRLGKKKKSSMKKCKLV